MKQLQKETTTTWTTDSPMQQRTGKATGLPSQAQAATKELQNSSTHKGPFTHGSKPPPARDAFAAGLSQTLSKEDEPAAFRRSKRLQLKQIQRRRDPKTKNGRSVHSPVLHIGKYPSNKQQDDGLYHLSEARQAVTAKVHPTAPRSAAHYVATLEAKRRRTFCSTQRPPMDQGAVFKHNSSHCRFSAWADPPGGGVWWLVCTLRGGGFALYKDPLIGQGGGGWKVAKIAENRQTF
jgi:hypothetical protein